ncbi:hypothetical protein Y032_0425g1233 [Ancylostoma ceylanicum]|nr:hypothetical protein Y032_0425g1233 [Ancylostoma ceylanicum]
MLYVRLIYCIPSIILYVTVVALLYKEKQRLFGSFYFLLIVQAITNIFVYINGFYLVQLANETRVNSWWSIIYTNAPGAVVRISACLGTHFAFVQTYMTFFISLNRVTFILRPGMDERIWKVAAPACAVTAYLSPFAATYPYLISHGYWIFSSQCHGFVTIFDPDTEMPWRALFIFLCVFLSLSSTVNIVSVVFLCKRSKRVRCTNMERSMLVLALLNFLIECSYFVLYALIYLSPYVGIDSSVSMALIPYASDVMTLSIPYLIVVLNRSIRSRLFGLFNCCKMTPFRGIAIGAELPTDPHIAATNPISHNSVSGVVNAE